LSFAGYLLFKDFCENIVEEPIPQIKFYEEVRTQMFYIFNRDSTTISYNLRLFTFIEYFMESLLSLSARVADEWFSPRQFDALVCITLPCTYVVSVVYMTD